ncbi:Nucleoid occlusion protein [archaeon HR01]|nr:Nucleoid occlusion protein [archaeon HR01]
MFRRRLFYTTDNLVRRMHDGLKQESRQLLKINVNMIRPIPWLPERTEMGDIISLARSMRSKGDVDVPIKVRRTNNGYYELVWGRRRVEAAKLAGVTEVTCIVEDLNDEEVFRQHAIENIHRKEKNCIEEAEFFAEWKRRFNLTYESIAQILGTDKKYIYNRVALLSLPQKLRQKIKQDPNNRFGVYHGLLLLKLGDKALQEKLGMEVIEIGLTTRELERRIEEFEKGTSIQESSEDEESDENYSKVNYFDLSLPLSEKVYNPLFPPPKIERIHIKRRRRQLISIQKIVFPTHVGTHIDSPHQFIKNGPKLQQFPLERFIGRGVVLYTPKLENEPIRLRDIKRNDVKIFEGDIVFFYTGWAKKYGTEKYTRHPYLSDEAVHWLIEKKAKLVGVDTPTIEKPYYIREKRFNYPKHRLLLSNNILIIEGLGDMEMLAGKRVFVYALPVVFKEADTYPVKVVAKVHNQLKSA